jgi:hypothetical protein
MPLSVSKLERFLSNKGLLPSKYFVMHSTIVYIEVLSIQDAETFMLYIPSRYNFKTKKGDNVFNIKYIDFDNIEDYTSIGNEHNIEQQYKEIDIPSANRTGNIPLSLEDNYRKNINLHNISNKDNKELNDIVRQMKRLKFCVQNVRYKLVILYKNFMCCINRNARIDCYTLTNFPSNTLKKLYVSVDLELLYEKIDTLVSNTKTIKNGLYTILENNHFKHVHTLQRLIEERDNILNFSEQTYSKKTEFDTYLDESHYLLETINIAEQSLLKKIRELDNKYSSGLHMDIERSQQISILENKLKEVQEIKQDIIKCIFSLNSEKENIILTVDKIMFDNNIMIDRVLNNFIEFEKLFHKYKL